MKKQDMKEKSKGYERLSNIQEENIARMEARIEDLYQEIMATKSTAFDMLAEKR